MNCYKHCVCYDPLTPEADARYREHEAWVAKRASKKRRKR